MRYTFSFDRPERHFIDIQFDLETKGAESVDVQLPSWRPGRYELGDFAKNVRDVSITDDNGKQLSWSKSNKDCWTVDTHGVASICVKYQFYAAEINAGSTFLDEIQFYVNPVNCCMYVKERMNEKVEVKLMIPSDFKVASSMNDCNGHFEVEDTHEFMDSPFICSAILQHKSFESHGIDFHVWFQGEVKPDWDKLIGDFKKYTDYQIDCFGGFPVSEYHYLIQILPYTAYHGVEHQKNTVVSLGPSYAIFKDKYIDLLGVSSHELYHTWNIKAIRPNDMFPYRYHEENHSRLGYVAEGVTTYMGDRMLFESGVTDQKTYHKELASQATRHFHNNGNLHYSVAESSWDTWLDGYVQGAPGRKGSIYTEGSWIAYCCDMRIRKSTGGQFSLHHAMKELYEVTNREKGYSEDQYWEILERVGQSSMQDIREGMVDGKGYYESQIKEALAIDGRELKSKPSEKRHEQFGLKCILKSGKIEVYDVYEGSAAYQAGFIRKDIVSAVNGYEVRTDLNEWLTYFKDEKVKVEVLREGRKISMELHTPNDHQFYNFEVSEKKELA